MLGINVLLAKNIRGSEYLYKYVGLLPYIPRIYRAPPKCGASMSNLPRIYGALNIKCGASIALLK
jgi:hypothetical protein